MGFFALAGFGVAVGAGTDSLKSPVTASGTFSSTVPVTARSGLGFGLGFGLRGLETVGAAVAFGVAV